MGDEKNWLISLRKTASTEGIRFTGFGLRVLGLRYLVYGIKRPHQGSNVRKPENCKPKTVTTQTD